MKIISKYDYKCFLISNAVVLLISLTFVHGSNENVCEQLGSPFMGDMTGDCDGTVAGGNCTAFCHNPFKLLGPSQKVCNGTTGNWFPAQQQICIDRSGRCHPLRPPLHGYYLGDCDNFLGFKCTIGCISGYQLVGSQYIYCTKSKKWEPERPRCHQIKCPVLQNPHHGSIIGSCGNHVGATCRAYCDPGYVLMGSSQRRCMSVGNWDGEPAKCVKFCSSVQPIVNGQLYGDCSPGIPGNKCHFVCRKGFHLNSDKSSITCSINGTWSSNPLQCKRTQCPPLQQPINGNKYGYCDPGYTGKPCIFTCKSGHWLNGPRSVYCKLNGEWSSSAPACKSVQEFGNNHCPDVPQNEVIYKLKGNCTGAKTGDSCFVQCLVGGDGAGRNVTCQKNGTWSPVDITCESDIRCHPPKRPKNGFLLNCDYMVGSICEQYCEKGFVSVGPSTRICLINGQWDGERLRCFKYTKRAVNNIFSWKSRRSDNLVQKNSSVKRMINIHL